MTLALAQDKLHYSSPQLEALSRQVQTGDLTAVMQIYEEDIKAPLRSAVQGTLLRSLFIQVQKAKVRLSLLNFPTFSRPNFRCRALISARRGRTDRSTSTRPCLESTSCSRARSSRSPSSASRPRSPGSRLAR